MNIWRWAKKHSGDVTAALDILLALSVAAYGGLFSYYLTLNHIDKFFKGLCNLLLAALVVLALMKIKLTAEVRKDAEADKRQAVRAATEERKLVAKAAAEEKEKLIKRQAEKTKAAVSRLLEAAVKTLALASVHSDPTVEIRAFCHLYNAATEALEPYVAWGYDWHPDEDSSVPCNHSKSERFVIVKAFKENAIKQEDVGREGVEHMPVNVWPDLKCVLAAPIRDFKADSHPTTLGVINFDANRTLEAAHFDGKQAREVCRLYAATIYDLLKD